MLSRMRMLSCAFRINKLNFQREPLLISQWEPVRFTLNFHTTLVLITKKIYWGSSLWGG